LPKVHQFARSSLTSEECQPVQIEKEMTAVY
jgi:hypothetical protein